MKKVLIFAGTTEGRELAQHFASHQIFCTVCVATEYGQLVMEKNPYINIRQGRMQTEEMKFLIGSEAYEAVIDATHPYAALVSETILKSMKGSSIPYYRLVRQEDVNPVEHANYFSTPEECGSYLQNTSGNILLTTGSKELKEIVQKITDISRLYVRVLPSAESIAVCQENGITGKHIIAMQGPFSTEMNEATIKQFQINYLVTKESGINGGFQEKIMAASNTGASLCILGKPKQLLPHRMSMQEVLEKFQLTVCQKEITFVGIGMGNPKLFTVEAQDALQKAQVIFGAKRLLEGIADIKVPQYPYYLAKDILPFLEAHTELTRAVVLFSGDTGFYSGASLLSDEINAYSKKHKLSFQLQIHPGISAVSYLAAKLQICWQDAVLLSIHGKTADFYHCVEENQKTFLLLSGAEDVRALGQAFYDYPEKLQIFLGYQLSYPDEKIWSLTPSECLSVEQKGLYTAAIINERPKKKKLSGAITDDLFKRAAIPMTKEEIRTISISKLKLTEDSIFYDIGSGTGSVAVTAACLSGTIKVYAIEHKEEAISLIQENKKLFHCTNLEIISADAPEGFSILPSPTHAFIGGSGGKLKQILQVLYRKNKQMRVVINAITLETLSQALMLIKEFPTTEESTIQLQTARAKKAGEYHLMQAENPVYIIAFTFGGEYQ